MVVTECRVRRLRRNTFISYAVTYLILINRGLIQAIPTSLPSRPIGEATKASNLRRIPPGVQGRSHFIYFLTSTDDEDAYEHVRMVLETVDLFHFHGVTHDAIMLRVFPITLNGRALRWKNRLLAGTITTWDLLKKEFILRYCHPFITAKKLKEIRNFKQERDETLYHAWARYNDLLYQCSLHDLNYQQNVHIFYTGLNIATHKILDFNGFIPLMTPTQALESIQVMADHSHDWYDETNTRERINDVLDNVDAIHESFKGEHLTKEYPLKKEDEAIKHSRYMESLEETIIKFCEDTIKK
ncbi:ribonuclease H-like domain-containing protein [Tanacetum coccineum]